MLLLVYAVSTLSALVLPERLTLQQPLPGIPGLHFSCRSPSCTHSSSASKLTLYSENIDKNYSHAVLSVDYSTRLLEIQSADDGSTVKWCLSIDTAGNIVIGYNLSNVDKKRMLNPCVNLQLSNKSVSIPLHLVDTLRKSSSNYIENQACSVLRKAVATDKYTPFLILEDGETFDFEILLDFCGVNPPAAHVWPQVPAMKTSLYLSEDKDGPDEDNPSFCNVRRLTGSISGTIVESFQPPVMVKLKVGENSTEDVSILCLEDFFNFLSRNTADIGHLNYILPPFHLLVTAYSHIEGHDTSQADWISQAYKPVDPTGEVMMEQIQHIYDCLLAFQNMHSDSKLSFSVDLSLNLPMDTIQKDNTTCYYDEAAASEYFLRDNDKIPGTFTLPLTTQMRLYVFLFVTSIPEQIWAEEIVQKWKFGLDNSNRPDYLCCSSAYINFVVAILQAETYTSETYTSDDLAFTHPSLRAVLLFLDKWIEDYGTFNDAVVVLSGVTAIKRFVQPGE